MSDYREDDLIPHFIYCGWHYNLRKHEVKFIDMIRKKMRKYEIQSSILTMLLMQRMNLVTKEKVKKAYEGKLKNYQNMRNISIQKYLKYFISTDDYKGSINDDLEEFLINIRNQKEVNKEEVFSFFTPKLTNVALKLVQEGDEEHLMSYFDSFNGLNPDVDVEEMQKSDSKSKYVHALCCRLTIPLKTEISRIEDGFPDAKKTKTHE